MVEAEEAIINAVVAKLGADIAHANAWQWQVGSHVPNGHHKGVRAIVLPSDEQPCHGHLQMCKFLKGLPCSRQQSALRLPCTTTVAMKMPAEHIAGSLWHLHHHMLGLKQG